MSGKKTVPTRSILGEMAPLGGQRAETIRKLSIPLTRIDRMARLADRHDRFDKPSFVHNAGM